MTVLHNAFFEGDTKQLNLFVVGVGNVGGKLLEQLYQQQKFLVEEQHLEVRVIAVANSKKMHFDPEGINLKSWKESLLNLLSERFL